MGTCGIGFLRDNGAIFEDTREERSCVREYVRGWKGGAELRSVIYKDPGTCEDLEDMRRRNHVGNQHINWEDNFMRVDDILQTSGCPSPLYNNILPRVKE